MTDFRMFSVQEAMDYIEKAMSEDGFDPVYVGERDASWLPKLANYIVWLRGEADKKDISI